MEKEDKALIDYYLLCRNKLDHSFYDWIFIDIDNEQDKKWFKIRKMESDDCSNVIHLLRYVYYSMAMENKDVRSFVNGFIKKDFCGKKFYNDIRYKKWVAVNRIGKVIGCIGLKGILSHNINKKADCTHYEMFEICRLAIHPHYRKYGIASSLLKVAENYAKKHNKDAIFELSTISLLNGIQIFYEKHGYQLVQQTKMNSYMLYTMRKTKQSQLECIKQRIQRRKYS